MKKWNGLSANDQQRAIDRATNAILDAVVKGTIRFSDELNGDTLQAEIDAAIKQANENRTPWFAGECVMEAVGSRLRGMGKTDAQDAYYPEVGEGIIRLNS